MKEPDKNEYWIDEYVFHDDPLIKTEQAQNRGGSGILTLKQGTGIASAIRDIVLGLNIPDYPK